MAVTVQIVVLWVVKLCSVYQCFGGILPSKMEAHVPLKHRYPRTRLNGNSHEDHNDTSEFIACYN
jgi:hypothetical protein